MPDSRIDLAHEFNIKEEFESILKMNRISGWTGYFFSHPIHPEYPVHFLGILYGLLIKKFLSCAELEVLRRPASL
ncbi:MAG: hypothetical protein WA347_06715 [Rhabdochlamydiaceae bacterium]